MTISYSFKIIFLYILLVTFPLFLQKSGINISISEDVIKKGLHKYVPKISSQFNDLDIPSQDVNIKVGFSNLHLGISNIKFHVTDIPVNKVTFEVRSPNIIELGFEDIQANGQMHIHLNYWIFSENYECWVNINSINFKALLTLDWERSIQYNNKFVPSFNVNKFKINLDFDFKLNSSVLGSIIKLFYNSIKNSIHDSLIKMAEEEFETKGKEIFSNIIQSIPLIPKIYEDIGLDYSLQDKPIIKDNNIIVIKSSGAIVNTSIPESMNPPYKMPDSLPEYDSNLNKNIQVFTNEYCVNTAINTLSLSNLLIFNLTNDQIPDSSPIKLNTTSLDAIFNGMIKRYGENVPCRMNLKITSPVKGIKLRDDIEDSKQGVEASLNAIVVLEVESNKIKKEYSQVVELILDFTSIATVKLEKNGILKSEIIDASIVNVEIKQSEIDSLDKEAVKSVLNLFANILIPIINKDVLDNIVIPIPEFDGNKFNDSVFNIKKDYIEFGSNPEFIEKFYINKLLSNVKDSLTDTIINTIIEKVLKNSLTDLSIDNISNILDIYLNNNNNNNNNNESDSKFKKFLDNLK